MEAYGRVWKRLEAYESVWKRMEAYGSVWKRIKAIWALTLKAEHFFKRVKAYESHSHISQECAPISVSYILQLFAQKSVPLLLKRM